MLSGTCAFCGNQTHFTARSARIGPLVEPDSGESRAYFSKFALEVAGTCDACHRFNSALGVSAYLQRSLTEGTYLTGADMVREAEAMTISEWSPPLMARVDVEFMPPGVAAYFAEAHDANSVNAYRAVLLLVRSVVEATAKDLEITSGSLVQKINQLAEDGHIRKGTREMAHALRILGNDMAHGDIDAVPTAEDASDALRIARFVLDDVYVADAVRQDMLARREGR
ncbi:DUF4145 domain-containing protein [Microbacterium sp. 3J1]|uniref:DUF4145 domain-containing protein n=1 Tax=Microbacterium sp. 3J1 TaxID=861269 RepID=UPI000A822CDE|nr:DUF4145 domain-containing protein [Microbacterium sp. 3J1]